MNTDHGFSQLELDHPGISFMTMLAEHDTLAHRIEQAEASFLTSLSDPRLVSSFESPWVTLSTDLLKELDAIDAATGASVHATATRVATIAGAVSDIHTESNAIEASLYSEIDTILDSMYPLPKRRLLQTPKDHSTPRETYTSAILPCPSSTQAGSKLSNPGVHYKWLLENVHYPFPPFKVKEKLLKALNVSQRSLDDWFSSARRKIGWTAFSKRYFKGNRCVTFNCTSRVFVEGKREGEYSEEIIRDLDEIKSKAEHLYGSADGAGTGSFAKELESIEPQTSVSSSKSRKRRSSTSSTTTDHSSSSSASTSSSSSRKRSRASSEESDTTCYSESSETDSARASKRARSVSPTFSCISQESSYSASSSDTADTVSEINTPTISPTYPTFPVEIIDNWIDDVSAEPIFLPHDIVDKPQSVLSQKRRSPDLESDSPTTKRARLSETGSQTLLSEESDNPISECRSIASAARAESVQPTPVQPLSEEPAGWSPVYGAPVLQPSTELDEETMDFLLSQMDFNVPQAAVPDWGQDILKSVVEVCPFDFGSIDLGMGSSIGFPGDTSSMFASSLDPCSPLPVSGDLLPDTHAPVLEKQPESADTTSASFSPDNSTTSTKGQGAISEYFASTPLSLTSEELEFLESLGNASQPPLPGVGAALAHDGKSAVPLIDFVYPSVAPSYTECSELVNAEKPQFADLVLEEARKLQQEVFG